MKENTEGDEYRPSWLLVSLVTTLLVSVSAAGILEEKVIEPRTLDGTLLELGRYAFIYDALEHLSDQPDAVVVGIGSSKLREGFDGALLEKESAAIGVTFANLGVAGDVPFYRMTSIEAVSELQPEVVVLELGPNSLRTVKNPLHEMDILRMNAMLYDRPLHLKDEFRQLLSEEDAEELNLGIQGWLSSRSDMGFEATDDALQFSDEDDPEFGVPLFPWVCAEQATRMGCVPSVDSPHFAEYLQHPPQFFNHVESLKKQGSGALEEFYGERLDNYIAGSSHRPEGVENKNTEALEFIIQELHEANVDVLLLGLPYNPVLEERLAVGAWDYYNETVSTFKEDERVTMLDLMWDPRFDDDVFFNDFSHMSSAGEKMLMEVIAPHIDGILAQRGFVMLEDHRYSTEDVVEQRPERFPTTMPIHGTVELNLTRNGGEVAGEGVFIGSSWAIDENGSLVSTPNADVGSNDLAGAPKIEYCLEATHANEFWIWLQFDPPDGRSDSIYLGVNDVLLDLGPRGVQGYKTGGGPWWRNTGDNGERISVELEPGISCLNLWVREDGVVIRNIQMTTDPNYSPEV